MLVAAVLVSSGVASAAIVGFWSGAAMPAFGIGAPARSSVVVVVAVALVADVVHARTGRLGPLAVRRQVPREWSRLFSPEAAAALYGARLGIGPLTILRTWLWWAGAVLAALHGPWIAAAWGAVFGATRLIVVIGTSAVFDRAMSERMAALRRAEPVAAMAIGALVLAAGSSLWLVG